MPSGRDQSFGRPADGRSARRADREASAPPSSRPPRVRIGAALASRGAPDYKTTSVMTAKVESDKSELERDESTVELGVIGMTCAHS